VITLFTAALILVTLCFLAVLVLSPQIFVNIRSSVSQYVNKCYKVHCEREKSDYELGKQEGRQLSLDGGSVTLLGPRSSNQKCWMDRNCPAIGYSQ